MIPQPGDTVGGKYLLEALLGRGGMGAVYRARNTLTGRRVALKWMLPDLLASEELRARIFREARAMGRIEHPNVCTVFDVGEDGSAVFLVMELLEGRSLRAMIADGPLPVAEACALMISAMQGVAAAHLAGVVHRDLKPDNLFVCRDRGKLTMKVLDFGVSKIADVAGAGVEVLTKTGTIVGTPHYMSPEQVMAQRDVDTRTDVYALGAILYEATSGHLPHQADGFSALMVRIATAEPDPFEEHAPASARVLAPIVHRALSHDREDRHPDVASLAAALEPFAEGVTFEAPSLRASLPPLEPTPLPRAAGAPTAATRRARPEPALEHASVAPVTGTGLAAPPIGGRFPRWPVAAVVLATVAVAWAALAHRAPDADGPPPAPTTAAARPTPEPTPEPATVASTPIEPDEPVLPVEPVASTAPPLPEVEPAAPPGPSSRSIARRREPVEPPTVPPSSSPPEPAPQPVPTAAVGRSGTLSTDDF